ncbi:vacuolar protein sorting-associated protein 35 [Tetranychus urticae]|uniref:Vacuolar protein sorting-associated protein 35 n=1 Tax=Tetranychus urticae TaxID=32264 RepID=T1JVR4_TETUR|nr:vacuolar protein sorting-associated protein 35 [Tetranychus urticae]
MSTTPATTPSDDKQEKRLDESLGNVKIQSFHMKCCLDRGKLMEALKHASNMITELRTNQLSPKSYYELYMAVCDQLRHMEMYLLDEFNRGRKLADLYELVQYAGNIIPRLYLLITVGLVYMKTTPGSRRDILKDLVEMCRGVQHPLRGLFLRNYLLQSCRNILPDVTVEEIAGDGDGKEEHSGTIEDSIEFILLNFAEMNKLWVRMQHQGHTRDKDRREKERLELRLLVGTNLVRLSQLESIDIERYKNVVLPGILEQVVSCRDGIAQEYLMECLIQVFPDEFHLTTLQPFLHSCAKLVPSVNVKNIIIALIDRLALSKDIDLPDDLFDIFSSQISNIIQSRPDMILEDIISMEGSLINFTIKKINAESKREESIDSVLQSTLNVIKEKCNKARIQYRTNIGKELLKFLKLPITHGTQDGQTSGIAPIKMSLKLKVFKNLLKDVTDLELQKQITLSLLNSALDSGIEDKIIEENRLTLEEIEIFLSELCEPLVKGAAPEELDGMLDEDFVDEQLLLSRFIHYLLSPICVAEDDLDFKYLIISSCKKILAPGGAKRVRFTFPALVFESLDLALKYSKRGSEEDAKWDKKCTKIYQFVNQTISALNESNCPDICLRLYLQAALNASKVGLKTCETLADEFVTKAVSIYEEEICETKERFSSLILIIGAIKEIDFKSAELKQPFASQMPLLASKLIQKPNQVRAILSSSLLFCDDSTISPEAIKCIKKCVKIASSMMDNDLKLQLYIEILAHITLLVSQENQELLEQMKDLNEKILEQKNEVILSESLEKQYNATLNFLQSQNISLDK